MDEQTQLSNSNIWWSAPPGAVPGAVAVADAAAVADGDTSFPSRKALASTEVTVLVTSGAPGGGVLL